MSFSYFTSIGKDAIRPFLVEPPLEVYKTANFDADVIFYHTNAVRIISKI